MKQTLITFMDKEMVIEDSNQISFVPYHSLVCVFFDNPYLIVESKDNRWMLMFTLFQMKEHLPYFFVQCNKATIINALLVEHFDKKNKIIQLEGNRCYAVSVRKKNELEAKLLSIRKNNDNSVQF